MTTVRICFVCLGNICRSPTAEGIMQHLVDQAGLTAQVLLDSAGTGAWHVGQKADSRSRATARERGIELTSIARRFELGDFEQFEYIVAMDRSNYDDLWSLARANNKSLDTGLISMLRSFDTTGAGSEGIAADVPDPYYGGERGFDDVFDICDAACRGLLDHIKRKHGL